MTRMHKYYPFAYSVLTLLLAAIVLISLANRNHEEFVRHQHEIMQSKVSGVANQVALLIDELRLELSLLSEGYSDQIAKIYDNPEDEESFDEFERLLAHYFPYYYAFTLVDQSGKILIDDFGEKIGDLCKNDIRTFVQTGHKQQVYIHPGPGVFHFDVMVPWSDKKGRRGVFFVSFKPDMIIRLLRDSETQDHKLYLIRQDTQDLVEVSSGGDRSMMRRESRLSSEELSRIGFSTPVQGTNWKLVSIYASDLFSHDKFKNSRQVLMALSGFVIMGGLLIFMVQREEKKRVKAELELINAKEVADMANLAKTQFLSNMSHELRTPLTSIMGFSDLLMVDDENPLTKEQLEDVSYINKAGLHLLDLINEVLDLTKIESGYIAMKLEAVQANEIIEDAISLVEPLAEKRGIKIYNKQNKNINFKVITDESRLREVILNLLSNAIKYNTENGVIAVRAENIDDKYLRISVSDTGSGIASGHQKDVFEPFNRLGADVKIEGTGIGLTITKRLVELMNGQIGVISKEGEGSTFWVSIPCVE